MRNYTHTFDMSFNVESDTADPANLTGNDVMDALLLRIEQLESEGHRGEPKVDIGGAFGYNETTFGNDLERR